MKNNLQLFDYEAQQVRTIIEEDGQVWFLAKDVCDILGYAQTEVAVRKLDEDEMMIRKFYVSSKNRDVIMINESGIYHLLFVMQPQKSPNTQIAKIRVEQIKKFRRWVTGEVLPSIRRTGSYDFKDKEACPIVLERFEGKLCVSAGSLIAAGIISKSYYGNLVERGTIKRLRRGCKGTTALVLWESVPQRLKNKLIVKYGCLPSISYSKDVVFDIVKDVCRIRNSELRLGLLEKIEKL